MKHITTMVSKLRVSERQKLEVSPSDYNTILEGAIDSGVNFV
jgi:hypothetical protein